MKINWQNHSNLTHKEVEELTVIEYNLRKKIVSILIAEAKEEYSGDFSGYEFDFDVETKQIEISNKTPEPMYSEFKAILKKRGNL